MIRSSKYLATALAAGTLLGGCGGTPEQQNMTYNGCNPSQAATEIQTYFIHRLPFEAQHLVDTDTDKPDTESPADFLVVNKKDLSDVYVDPLVLTCGKKVVGYAGIDNPYDRQVKFIAADDARVAKIYAGVEQNVDESKIATNVVRAAPTDLPGSFEIAEPTSDDQFMTSLGQIEHIKNPTAALKRVFPD